jgi:hypothetical protein
MFAPAQPIPILWRNSAWRPRVRVRPGAPGRPRYRARFAARVRRSQALARLWPSRTFVFSRLPCFPISPINTSALSGL